MLMLRSSIDEESLKNFDDDREIYILVVCGAPDFTRCDLHQNPGYYEFSSTEYSIAIDEFKSHFRMAKDTTEAL